MITLSDFNFENKKALIRVDFNVPLNAIFEVTDATRIVSAKPTIIKVLEDYKSDKMGNSSSYSRDEKDSLLRLFDSFSNVFIFTIYKDEKLAGGAVCFKTFSTFKCKPLINIHDFCIISEFRSQGFGKSLMKGILETLSFS